MFKIEKALFLELTHWQFGKWYILREMLDLLESFNESEKTLYLMLKEEARGIFNYINSPNVLNVVNNEGVDSIFDFNDKVETVSETLLEFCKGFGITLKKDDMTEEYKKAIIDILGLEFFEKHYKE